MSTDFSEIMAAMSSVPDIVIDPNSGATIGGTGKTLGDKYQMEGRVSPKIAEKIRENRVVSESQKEESRSQVDAYKEMIGVPTGRQIRDAKEAERNNQAILENHFNEITDQPIQEQFNTDIHRQGVEKLHEEVENPMMDMYVNSIIKKNKWSK
jgi:hypothetical protein